MTTPNHQTQVKNLLLAKYHKAMGMNESEFRKLLKTVENNFKDGDLIVIPMHLLSAEKQMECIGGKSYLTESNIEDHEAARPYLISDIEDGSSRKNVSPRDNKKNIEKEGKRGLTAAEGIALVLQCDTLKTHNIDLVGSKYGSGSVPFLCLVGEQPALRSGWGGDPNPEWGAPSCGSARTSDLGTSASSVPSALGLAGKTIKLEIDGVSYVATLEEAA